MNHFVYDSNWKRNSGHSKVKLAMLLRVLGQHVNDMYEGMVFGEGEDKEDFETIVVKLDSLCIRRTSKHVLWDKFFQHRRPKPLINLLKCYASMSRTVISER